MSHFAIINVPADGLAQLGARASAVTEMIRDGPHVYEISITK